MTTNYTRGVNIEYKAKKELEAKGYFVTRSSGSHGIADLISISPFSIKVIQIKRSKKALTPAFIDSFYNDDIIKLKELILPDNCHKELWLWVDRTGWNKFRILPDRIEII